jgi:hypothetical protein
MTTTSLATWLLHHFIEPSVVISGSLGDLTHSYLSLLGGCQYDIAPPSPIVDAIERKLQRFGIWSHRRGP